MRPLVGVWGGAALIGRPPRRGPAGAGRGCGPGR
nr:MAG TPA: hypothetical protein [Caudoviricetes sp.]